MYIIGSISKSVSTSRKICTKLLFWSLFLQIFLLANTNFVSKLDRLEILSVCTMHRYQNLSQQAEKSVKNTVLELVFTDFSGC